MPMFTYNLWMRCLQPDTMSIILSSYQHCDEQQFQTLSCALYTIVPVLKLDLVIQHCYYITLLFWEKIRVRLACILKTISVSYSVLLGACPQHCSKRADRYNTIYIIVCI